MTSMPAFDQVIYSRYYSLSALLLDPFLESPGFRGEDERTGTVSQFPKNPNA
jgi:hypothetical protein